MQGIFTVKSSNYLLREINNLEHYRPNQVIFGSNTLRFLGPQIWNGLPNDIKSAENLTILNDMLNKRVTLWGLHYVKLSFSILYTMLFYTSYCMLNHILCYIIVKACKY